MPEHEVIKNGICYMCTASCPMKIHVSHGKATKINWGIPGLVSACPRWKAQLDFVYHHDRLKYPLKRMGEKGSTNFKRISWNEALDTIAENLQRIKNQYGPEAVAFWVA